MTYNELTLPLNNEMTSCDNQNTPCPYDYTWQSVIISAKSDGMQG